MYFLYFAWVLLVTLWVSKGPFFAFTTVHALQSAFFGVAVSIVAVFNGFSVPMVLIPFFAFEFIVFLMSKRGAWFEGFERCMGYMFRSSMIPFSALVVFVGREQAAIPFVIAGMFEGLYVLYQKLIDCGAIQRKLHYIHKVGRFVGTLGNPNHASEFLLVTLVIALWVSQTWPVFFWSVPFIFWGLVFTAGRATLVSAIVGAIFLSVFSPVTLLISLPIVGLLAIKLKKRIHPDKNRLLFWKVLLREKLKHPFKIEGLGVKNYVQKLSDTELKRRIMFHPLDRAHNWFIDLIVEGGILYTSFFIAASIVALIYLPPMLKAALVVLLVNEFFSFPFQPNYLLWIFLVSIGTAIALPIWVLAPFLAVGFWIGFKAYLAGRKVAAPTRNFFDAYHNHRTALELSPTIAAAYYANFIAQNVKPLSTLAPSEIERLEKVKEPALSWEFHKSLAETCFILKDLEKAQKHTKEGLEAAPGNYYLQRMEALLSGNHEKYLARLRLITRDFLAATGKNKNLEYPMWIDLMLNSPPEQREQYRSEYRERFGEELDLKKVEANAIKT